MDKLINKKWNVLKKEYCSTMKKMKYQYMQQWMYLKGIILSERSQRQKAIYCLILFIWNAQNRKIYREKKINVYQRIEEGQRIGCTC